MKQNLYVQSLRVFFFNILLTTKRDVPMGLAFLEVDKIYFWTSKNIPESRWLKYASESPQNFPRISSDHLLVIAKKKNRTFFLRNLLWDYRPWEALYDWSTKSEDFCTKLSKSEFPTRSAINLPCLDWVCPCCTVYHLFQQMCNNDDDIKRNLCFHIV